MRKPPLLALALTLGASALSAQPVLVKDIRTGPALGSSLPDLLHDAAPLGGLLYFRGDDGFFGNELWRSDGTAEGTRLVADLCPGRCSAAPERFTAAAGLLFLLGDVLPGARSSSPREFTAIGEWLVFNAGRPLAGYELFRLPRTALAVPDVGIASLRAATR
ncbi:MAG TPA: ELWxxDGT repeat protein [Thermoanaerobaculia bacterium]|nr:ELWxxDGT repeat protein [Thermoanaerobaculia bacterium]